MKISREGSALTKPSYVPRSKSDHQEIEAVEQGSVAFPKP
jgi:hypothetical protein